MDILLKLDCKLLSNTFHMSYRSCLYHKKNLRFSHLHLVAKEFYIWLPGSFAAREFAIDILLKLNCKLLSNTFDMSHIYVLIIISKNLRFGHLHLVAKEFCVWLLGRLPWRFHFSKFEMWIQRPFQQALNQVCTFSSC